MQARMNGTEWAKRTQKQKKKTKKGKKTTAEIPANKLNAHNEFRNLTLND